METLDLYKYQQVKTALTQAIISLPSGSKLPNRNELSVKYSAARTTIERAIAELINEGWLSSKKGSGTFVSWSKDEIVSSKLHLAQEGNVKSEATQTFALLISNILNDIYPYILRGVQDVMAAHGMNIIVNNTDNSISKQEEIIHKLRRDGISGFIIVPAINGEFNPECFNKLKQEGIPFVTCFRTLQGMYAPGVFCNSFQSGFICTEHLIKHGCKNIAYISAPFYATSFDRYQGYLLAHEMYSITPQKELRVFDKFFDTCATGVRATDALLVAHPEVDGIFAFNDRIAVGIYESMENNRLIPGDDIKIVSCDNTSVCTQLPVHLTSARFPVYEIGENAAKLLIKLCDGNEMDDMTRDVVSSELVIRNSCGCRNGSHLL